MQRAVVAALSRPSLDRPWSTFADADAIAAYNLLRRVPTLVLDDGEGLIEIFSDPRLEGTAPRHVASHVPIIE